MFSCKAQCVLLNQEVLRVSKWSPVAGLLSRPHSKGQGSCVTIKFTQHLLRDGGSIQDGPPGHSYLTFRMVGSLAKGSSVTERPCERRTGSPGRGAWLLTVDTRSCAWDTRAQARGTGGKGLGRGVMGPKLQTETRR